MQNSTSSAASPVTVTDPRSVGRFATDVVPSGSLSTTPLGAFRRNDFAPSRTPFHRPSCCSAGSVRTSYDGWARRTSSWCTKYSVVLSWWPSFGNA